MKDYSEALNKDAVEKAVLAAGLVVLSQAKMNCPVNTGRLRNSLCARTYKSEQGFNDETSRDFATIAEKVSAPSVPYECHVGTNVEYGENVELGIGTRKQPYLVPAAILKHGKATEAFNKVIEKAMEGIVKNG